MWSVVWFYELWSFTVTENCKEVSVGTSNLSVCVCVCLKSGDISVMDEE